MKKTSKEVTAPQSRGCAKKLGLAERVIALVEEARGKVAKAANVALVYTYYEVGRMIVEDEQGGKKRAAYGKAQLADLSRKLTERFGKGWSVENLTLMRRFYNVYSNWVNGVYPIVEAGKRSARSKIVNGVYEIQQKRSAKSCAANQQFETAESTALAKVQTPETRSFVLSWSHYLVLMRIENPEERRFYEIEAAENGWDLVELKRQYKSSLYERLALSRDKKGVLELSKPEDVIKDPYVLEFLGLEERERYSETELEARIIEHVEQFILEMGKGFIRVGRQVRFTFQEKHFRVDLVFYNRILRCFVLVDLKTGELTHGDVGQMMMYVNYYDRKVKMADENPSIGILLCADKDDAIVEMTLPEKNRQIFASKYLTVLPDKEALRSLVRKQLGSEK